MFSGDVVRAVYPDHKDDRRMAGADGSGAARGPSSRDAALKAKAPNGADGTHRGIPIRGLNSDVAVRFAPNGGAVPGDRIVGIFTPGEGVTIYPIQSTSLAAFDNEPDRWIDVRWEVDATDSQRFPARIALQSINEPGSLAQIAQVIADHDGNIDNVSMKRRTQDFTDMVIDLSVWDLKHLNAIISELRAKRVVSRVDRVTG
jgi:GTP pyrophosphokinase